MRKFSITLLTVLMMGYAFLYVPILILIAFSFNKSRLVTVWDGFSLRWYESLWHNDQLLNAAWVSLKVATLSATLSILLGTLAALVLARFGRFKGRTLLSGLVTAPLVMPEVITGLSLLILFVSLKQVLGWPETRGVLTITIAHTTLAIAYVTAIIQSRLSGFDNTLIEAALDLGARPLKAFFLITLPLIAPALGAGWLLAFALSLDDLVIASFVSGPGSTTLPMVIFSSVKLGVTPQINALATLIVVFVSLGVLVSGWLIFRKSKEKVIKIKIGTYKNAYPIIRTVSNVIENLRIKLKHPLEFFGDALTIQWEKQEI